ncbi:amino acid ABC transporter permease [Sphaerochaeta sp.]|jgi:general L-amino acid transport system permease protein|uniref:amino acid ABC transporter permease n=1 Tax=Sphaerochaeta sp. TaxID=1972642 RepID=UPI002FC6C8CE
MKEQTIQLDRKPNRMLHWMHTNLFSTIGNTLLTALSVLLLYEFFAKAFIPLFSWDWTVIKANLKLILTGSYPISELWRVWVCLGYATFFFGCSFGMTAKRPQKVLYGIALFLAALSFLPFGGQQKTSLRLLILILFGSFFLIQRIGKEKQSLVVTLGWVFLLPFSFCIIRGFGFPLPLVKTNLWGGLLLSLLISLTSIFLSLPIGLLLALGRRSNLRILKSVCIFTIEIIRGVPLITILFIGYLILPMALPKGWAPSVFIRALTGVVMFHSAYMAEALRGGLQGISKTQYEAAKSLNLSTTKTMALVILPQVLKRMIPVLVNMFTSALKDTSLISIIGMLDLIGISTSIVSNPKYLTGSAQVLFFEGAIYFILCYSISKASILLEKKLGVTSKIHS